MSSELRQSGQDGGQRRRKAGQPRRRKAEGEPRRRKAEGEPRRSRKEGSRKKREEYGEPEKTSPKESNGDDMSLELQETSGAAPAAQKSGVKIATALEAACKKGVTTDVRMMEAKKVVETLIADGAQALLVETDLFAAVVKELDRSGKSGANAREGACLVLQALVESELFPLVEHSIISLLSKVISCTADKQKRTAMAASAMVDSFLEKMDVNTVATVLPQLFVATPSAKSDVRRLEIIQMLCTKAKAQMPYVLESTIAAVAREVHNLSNVVGKAARATLLKLCAVCDNVDIVPLVPTLMDAVEDRKAVKTCVLKLASTTFVEIIDSAALAIICPILVRGFKTRSVEVQRGCARIAENLATLVEDPRDLQPFLPSLLPLIQAAATECPNPGARAVCAGACEIVAKKAAEPALSGMVTAEEVLPVFNSVLAANQVSVEGPNAALAQHIGGMLIMNNMSSGGAEGMARSLAPRLAFLDAAKAGAVVAALQKQAKRTGGVQETEAVEESAEVLCDCDFSLAFGNNVLLRKTRMVLHRGKRYGLIGKNDSGKTSTMRAIAEHRVEGFPTEDELRTIFVETDIPVAMADFTVMEYMLQDADVKKLGLDEKSIATSLEKVGFVEGSPANLGMKVGSLSGGWRMKLALTRAMLLKADILLLDEPTNHLDAYNKAWVEDYLMGLPDVTSIFVSHDSEFLNKLCTHIIHIDRHRLHFYPGNLSDFAKKVPSAKSFFELKSEKVKFQFPNPGPLKGVTSKGKAIMKMTDITFTYPGAAKPQLNNVTVQISLGSRVACVGVNGAGKSTMIKLLTGELLPDEKSGKIWSHPNCRVGYIAQQAFHHIENHMDKTANEYIRWRYQNGNDREETKKVTNIVTPEEQAKMEEPIIVKTLDEATGKETKKSYVIERLTEGRRTNKAKREQEYQCRYKGGGVTDTVWILRRTLSKHGWDKLLTTCDQRIAMREAMYAVPLTSANVAKHLDHVGLQEEFSTHVTIGSLSGGQKVKVVLAAALWNRPHILILDEPTNYLDRDSLGALADAIRAFEGGVVMITHNSQFCDNLCPTVWHLENHTLNIKGDAEWMKQMAAESLKEEKAHTGEMVDKHGNTIKLKKNKSDMTNKERKKRAKLRAKRNKQRRKMGLEEEFSSDED